MKCTVCGKSEDATDFYFPHKGDKSCKACIRNYNNNRRKQFVAEYRERDRARYARDRDKRKTAVLKAYWANPEKVRTKKRNRYAKIKYTRKFQAQRKRYYLKAKARILVRAAEYVKQRRQVDPTFRLMLNLRSRMGMAFGKNKKCASTQELLGAPVERVLEHLEKQFKPGMSWKTRHLWHIDHIRPCASFNLSDPIQQRQCFHYTNLRPLWVKDNLSRPKK